MHTYGLVLLAFLCVVRGVQIPVSYQVNAIDDEICKTARDMGNLEWNDDVCHKFKCEVIDGKQRVAVSSCQEPPIPPSAIKCQRLTPGDQKLRFPLCCPKLLCLVSKAGVKFLRIVGQPGHKYVDEPLRDEKRFTYLYQVLSSRRSKRDTTGFKYEDDSAPNMHDRNDTSVALAEFVVH